MIATVKVQLTFINPFMRISIHLMAIPINKSTKTKPTDFKISVRDSC